MTTRTPRPAAAAAAAAATIAASLAAAALAGAAFAQAPAETIRYGYDARGRLISVKREGQVNKTTTYEFDKAHNRTQKKTMS
jgi:hypothetical protein